MGASNSSFSEDAFTRINNEANRMIQIILDRGYTDRDQVCKEIGYEKVNELSRSFSIATLSGVRYQFGFVDTNTDRQKICLDIVNFYVKKVNLITNIQKKLAECHRNRVGLNYQAIELELEKIRNATTMEEIDTITMNVNALISVTNCGPSVPQPVITRQVVQPMVSQPTPQVHTVVKEVPVTQRTVYKPVVTRHEVVHQLVAPIVTRPIVRPVVTQPVVTRPVLVPLQTPEKEVLPEIPVHTVQGQRRSVQVSGERIRRENGTLIVENPNQVNVLRTGQNIRPGTPVRALGNHTPKTPGETYLKEGQATSYIRPGPRNWAYVRHSNGQQGYVPATHISL